ncbi:hypothetical protein LWI28_019675 [Acer negundo]|uniref:Uncharacterized protein n=1 Tax=Acer negundo TaxID=4023 RepID=A0AAD5JLT7_ACENE|nr:hypothetical protein LWI28_019675 [Acer negundo]KAK4855745.1 hypothetical protein QYF36_010441 [Acer negundo]
MKDFLCSFVSNSDVCAKSQNCGACFCCILTRGESRRLCGAYINFCIYEELFIAQTSEKLSLRSASALREDVRLRLALNVADNPNNHNQL